MAAEPVPLSAPDIGEAEIEAVVEVLRSSRLSLGPRLEAFEAAAAATAGVRHAVAVSSGTAGLHAALVALGVGPGDEVITPAFSFVASANAIEHCGARTVLVDVDERRLAADPDAVAAAVTPRTRAVLPVHVFGVAAPMDAYRAIAERRGLRVIEDACEAIGGRLDGRPLGGLGDVGVFAFYPNKQVTTGEGGALVTDDDGLASRLRRLRNHGRDPDDPTGFRELGWNYRLPEIACALGAVQLGRLPRLLERRAAVAARYARLLGGRDDLELPPADTASWFVYVVRVAAERRDEVVAGLTAEGIGCGRYFPPIHLLPHYRARYGHAPGEFPVTEAVAASTVALPFSSRLADHQVDRVAETLLAILDRGTG